MPLAEKLTPEIAARIQQLRAGPFKGKRLEKIETEYQQLVQPQSFADLAKLYDPKNEDRLQITYPAFTPLDAPHGGQDLGFGLHVVKRLVLPLPGGLEKIIEVNEHWAQDATQGGLFFPDEIRMKSLVFEGPRRVAGSEKLYLFDSLRLGWGQARELTLYRQTRFIDDTQTERSRKKNMRVPVSAPVSCKSCHASQNTFAPKFLGPHETLNAESIVQSSYFSKPLETTGGFKEYLEDLKKRGRSETSLAATRQALLNPQRTTQIPGLYEMLKRGSDTFNWLGEDTVYRDGNTKRQGVYRCGPDLCLDSLETTLPGKYLWWDPEIGIGLP